MGWPTAVHPTLYKSSFRPRAVRVPFRLLTEEVVLFPENPDYTYIIDMVGGVESGSDEDIQTYLKYYTNEQQRVKWGHDWP